MKRTVYNPQKGRLETIQLEITDKNTTWFDCDASDDISMITDVEGGLVITGNGWVYPVLVYDISRASIQYNQCNAKEIREEMLNR